jgi:hypothetical protein
VGTAAVGTPGTLSTTPVGQVHEKSTRTGKTSPLATPSNTGHAAAGQWTRGQLQRLTHRFLGLHGLSDLRGRPLDPKQSRPSAYTEGLWGFLLTPLPDGRTRLVIGGYEAFRPRWLASLSSFFGVAIVWIMQARMLVVLKRNAERMNQPPSASISQ